MRTGPDICDIDATSILSAQFFTDEDGYALFRDPDASTPLQLFATHDGGASWSKLFGWLEG
jgi:photosystem II stability/assembly factor-like uncharacterized protein